jgi:pyruvate formate lyase activating enzyme
MTLAGIVKSSLVDYPGLVSCILFTPGCNYDCYYCHNRQLIDGTHQAIDRDAVTEFLKKRTGLLDAPA